MSSSNNLISKTKLVESAFLIPTVNWRGLKLCGKVKVVKSFADIKVQVVKSFPDLKVQKVSSFPDKIGQWQFVDAFPDFTIRFVDSFPDIKIQYVDSFPGVR